ncbi:hypothetical protein T4B_8754 [Trichinella pseudospiralis]|uniref:Uncharacterized protein n=1 Tax=Trichinella pseudospiralis TaxID=6337 RepID=A0A0V1JCV3_TRIPS|nr:hypothetical protein T4B_8754 [Trichinella pseudospiralis]KRZ32373.1 hypothetical protein T4C_10282 [Trichinella pseudospiralis]
MVFYISKAVLQQSIDFLHLKPEEQPQGCISLSHNGFVPTFQVQPTLSVQLVPLPDQSRQISAGKNLLSSLKSK